MVYRYEYHGGVWIDLEQPTEDEILDVTREYPVSERIETELLTPTPAPLIANDPNTVLLVLHFPAHGDDHGETRSQEVDFLVGPDFIVTVRYEVVASIYHLKKLLETENIVSGEASIRSDTLLEIIFAHLYTSVRDHANHSADSLARVEKTMFDGHERSTVRAVSIINREYLDLEAALANQEEPLVRFLQALTDERFFGPTFADRITRILAERTQIARLIRTHRAIAAELRETNTTLLEARQNEIMKTLTMITVVVLPLELIAFILGIHAPGTPLENNPNAFWIIMAVMLAAVGAVVAYFARKRWF